MTWRGFFIDVVLLACFVPLSANAPVGHFVVQNAGNMGAVSTGIGWGYGQRNRWESDLLVGYIPRHDASRGRLTMTVKENFIPWSIGLPAPASRGADGSWRVEPFTASLYLNAVCGRGFGGGQSNHMLSRFRLNLAVGQRVALDIAEHGRIALFYEVSTCDLYLRALFQDSDVDMKDILGLSLGVKFYL